MKKVLIISSAYFGYHLYAKKAFFKLGYDVSVETYDDPIHPFKGLLKWRYKFSPDKESLKERSRRLYKGYIEAKFDEYNPDMVFVFNGAILKAETLDYFRSKGVKVLFWMYDSVMNPIFKNSLWHIDHVDVFCCFERGDVEFYESHNKKAYYLPMACNEETYFPIEQKEKDIDILFVGVIYISEKRKRILEALAKRYRDKNLLFYGHYKPYYKNPISWLFRRNRKVFRNVNISPSDVNKLYSRTKIALNIHNKQTVDGANPRVFEVCGARAYQICDRNPYIESVFENGEVGLYDNEEELFALVDDALANDKSVEARQGYDIIINNHTFDKRVEQMLEWLEEKR